MKRSSDDWSLLSTVYGESFDELHLSAESRRRILRACEGHGAVSNNRKLSRFSFIVGAAAVLAGGVAVAMRWPSDALRLDVAYAANYNGNGPCPLASDSRGMMLAGVSQGLTAYFKLNLSTNIRTGKISYLLSDAPIISYDYQTNPFTKPGVEFVGENGEQVGRTPFEMEVEAEDTVFLDQTYLAVNIDPLPFYQSDSILALYWEFMDMRRTVCDLKERGQYVDALVPDRMSREIEYELSTRLNDVLADPRTCADWISRCYAAYVCNAATILAEMQLVVLSGDERVTYEIFPAPNLEESARSEMATFIEGAYGTELHGMYGASDDFWGVPFWNTIELLSRWTSDVRQVHDASFYIQEVERR